MELTGIKPRDYQKNILETSKNNNTLVVLPTGMGKTAIALLLAIERLKQHPKSKICLVSPTKPLCNQHLKTFQKHLKTSKTMSLLTGQIPQSKRKQIYKKSSVIIATPQTIQSDLKHKRINLKDFSLLVIDEAHRSRQKYANTVLAKKYTETSDFPRILALTASPGSTKEKINEIKDNLFIDNIEIRTESDHDVKPYVQEKEIEYIDVELQEKYKEILKLVSSVYKEKLKLLHNYGISKPTYLINKRDLVLLQKEFQIRIRRRDRTAYSGISLVAFLLKLNHACEMLETQGISSFKKFMKKIKTETSKASKAISNNSKIINAIKITDKTKLIHPKLEKIISIVLEQLKEKPKSNIIIFANFRFTVDEIKNYLSEFKQIKPVKLIGQKEGLSQKEQVEIIKNFEEGIYNVLVGTCILEEGLDLKRGCDTAIFYDNVPSSIRRIQRSGRVGRMKPGKIIFLITKNTRDAGYYWKSQKDEKRMKNILYKMKNENNKKL